MKIRYFSLGIAILVCATLLATSGAYLKYEVLKPLNLYQDKSLFELPFLMYGDDYLRFMIENAEELKQMEQQGSAAVNPNPTPGTSRPNPTEPSGSQDSTDDSDPTTESSSADTDNSSAITTDPSGSSSAPQDSSEGTSSDTPPSSSQTTSPPTSSSTAPPATTTPPSTAPSTSPPATDAPNFEFSTGVDEGWFENVLFIGDSRVVGLREYARSGNAEYFCDVGMSLLNYENKHLSDKNFPSQTLESLLGSRQYDKIIINFGLNESGYSDYSFQLMYKNFVNMVRQAQPEAIIILQGIMSVSKSKADSAYYFEPGYLASRSAFIASLADGVNVFFIDCNEYFSDENGYLYSAVTNDGYHPTVNGYRYWRDWIAFALEEIGL